MSEQPAALRLADELKSVHGHRLALDAAAELRRLYEENQKLLEALKLALEALENNVGEYRVDGAKAIIREALAEHPAQGCDFCNNPHYAGIKCKNCGREQPAQQQYTYASTQATMCAGCGEHKHTPLRIDAMGGYVCLTCIDKKLGSLLGEFGYPQPAQQEPVAIALNTGTKQGVKWLKNVEHGVSLYTSPQPASRVWPCEKKGNAL